MEWVCSAFRVADGPKTATLVFSVGGIALAFPWDFAVSMVRVGGKVRETRLFMRCQSARWCARTIVVIAMNLAALVVPCTTYMLLVLQYTILTMTKDATVTKT